ncbi:hypothetical protein SUGI_0575390 [Cryptomeria japonica]|nr:hypothetical protein SUGI_0575390 [Cryptomeria japonica]
MAMEPMVGLHCLGNGCDTGSVLFSGVGHGTNGGFALLAILDGGLDSRMGATRIRNPFENWGCSVLVKVNFVGDCHIVLEEKRMGMRIRIRLGTVSWEEVAVVGICRRRKTGHCWTMGTPMEAFLIDYSTERIDQTDWN